MICKICNKDSKKLFNHIQWNHKDFTTKSYYDKFLRKEGEGICVCGKEPRFSGFTHGYAKTCGYSCHHKQKFLIPGYLEKHKKMCSKVMSEMNKKNWQDEEYSKKMLAILKTEQEKLLHFKFNKCEKKLFKILQKFNSDFEYTGDWSRFIGNKSPDFVNEKKKLVVEMFGDFWHRNDTPEQIRARVDIFKSHGYNTLIVWENELKNTVILEDKINNFLRGECL